MNYICNNIWSILQTIFSGIALGVAYNILNKQNKFQNKQLEVNLLYQQYQKICNDSLFIYNEQKGYKTSSEDYKLCAKKISELTIHSTAINKKIEQLAKELGLGIYRK